MDFSHPPSCVHLVLLVKGTIAGPAQLLARQQVLGQAKQLNSRPMRVKCSPLGCSPKILVIWGPKMSPTVAKSIEWWALCIGTFLSAKETQGMRWRIVKRDNRVQNK